MSHKAAQVEEITKWNMIRAGSKGLFRMIRGPGQRNTIRRLNVNTWVMAEAHNRKFDLRFVQKVNSLYGFSTKNRANCFIACVCCLWLLNVLAFHFKQKKTSFELNASRLVEIENKAPGLKALSLNLGMFICTERGEMKMILERWYI